MDNFPSLLEKLEDANNRKQPVILNAEEVSRLLLEIEEVKEERFSSGYSCAGNNSSYGSY